MHGQSFSIRTHDAWGSAEVARLQSLEEAREVFATVCQDPWYQQDGSVKGVELLQDGEAGGQRLDWFAFR